MDRAVLWAAGELTVLDLRGLGVPNKFIRDAERVYGLVVSDPKDQDFYAFTMREIHRGDIPIPLNWQPDADLVRDLVIHGYGEGQLGALVAHFVVATRKAGSEMLYELYGGDVNEAFKVFVTTPVPPLLKKLLSKESYEKLQTAGITRSQLMAGFADLVLEFSIPISLQKEDEVVAYLLNRFSGSNGD